MLLISELDGNCFLPRLLVSGCVLVFVGRMFVSRRTFGEERRRAERIVAAESSFDDDIDAVGERVGGDAAIDNVIGMRPIGHLEGDLSASRVADDGAVYDARADLDAGLVERRVRLGLCRELTGGQIVDPGVLDGTRGEVARGANDQSAADEEFGAWLHEWNIRVGAGPLKRGPRIPFPRT